MVYLPPQRIIIDRCYIVIYVVGKMGDGVVHVLTPDRQDEQRSTLSVDASLQTQAVHVGSHFPVHCCCCTQLSYMAGDHKSMACSSGPCPRVTLAPQVPCAVRSCKRVYDKQRTYMSDGQGHCLFPGIPRRLSIILKETDRLGLLPNLTKPSTDPCLLLFARGYKPGVINIGVTMLQKD